MLYFRIFLINCELLFFRSIFSCVLVYKKGLFLNPLGPVGGVSSWGPSGHSPTLQINGKYAAVKLLPLNHIMNSPTPLNSIKLSLFGTREKRQSHEIAKRLLSSFIISPFISGNRFFKVSMWINQWSKWDEVTVERWRIQPEPWHGDGLWTTGLKW